MRYISIDPATKSIAIAIIDYDGEVLDPNDMDTFKYLKVISTMTKDLAEGVRNDSIADLERIRLTIECLDSLVMQYVTGNTTVVIEKQISGTKTYINYITLCTFFTLKGVPVVPVAPTGKNTLTIGGEKPNYKKYYNSYTTNKEHSRSMFNLIKDHLGHHERVKYNKKHERDLSDCFTQLIYLLLTSADTYVAGA